MKLTRLVLLLVVLAGAAAGGWLLLGRRANASGANAQLSLRLRGKYPGNMVVPVTLSWCPVTRIGLLEGVSGDSGVAIALYERDSLTAGPHPLSVMAAGSAAATPGASMVMRWMRLTPDTSVAGFRAESGTVRIQFAAGRASGDINARLRSATGIDSLTVQGSFSGVPVLTTARGCT